MPATATATPDPSSTSPSDGTAKPQERKIRQPPDFSGDRTQSTLFINTCRTYLRLNGTSYPTDEDKIIFILSFMEGGVAGSWKENFMDQAFQVVDGVERGFGTYKEFVDKFNVAFQPLSPAADCIAKMKSLKQTGPAEYFIAAFHTLATKSTITDLNVLSDYFLTGLTSGLRMSVMSVEKLPSSMEGYYELTNRLDLQWRKAKEYSKETRVAKPPTTPGTTQTSTTAPVRLRKLTEAERLIYRKDGICFRCRKPGHIARDCKGEPAPSSSTSAASSPRIRVVTPKPAEVPPPVPDSTPLPPMSRIRAVFATLSDAEKAEVVSIAEMEGF